MLNPNWARIYDPKDLKDWAQLEDTAPPVVYPFQNQILYRLLGKYYRTNGGNLLHPDNPRKSGAFFDMVSRTMKELEKQVILRDDYEKRKHEKDWSDQQEKDEDPMDRTLREDELRRDSSLKRICMREDVNLGRFWISPQNEVYNMEAAQQQHIDWAYEHKDLFLKTNNLGAFRPLFDGWIRVSGGYIEMYSKKELHRVADFLKKYTFDTERDYSIAIVTASPDRIEPMKINEIISQCDDNGYLELQASASPMISYRKSSNVPNPLRRNYDYSSEMGGPEWQSRVKNFEKKKKSGGGKVGTEKL